MFSVCFSFCFISTEPHFQVLPFTVAKHPYYNCWNEEKKTKEKHKLAVCPTRPNSCVDALLLFLSTFIARVNHKTKHGGTLIGSSIYFLHKHWSLVLRTLRGSNFSQFYRPYLVVFSLCWLREGSGVRTNSNFPDHKTARTFCTLEPPKPVQDAPFCRN